MRAIFCFVARFYDVFFVATFRLRPPKSTAHLVDVTRKRIGCCKFFQRRVCIYRSSSTQKVNRAIKLFINKHEYVRVIGQYAPCFIFRKSISEVGRTTNNLVWTDKKGVDTAYLKVRYLELMLFRIRRYKMTRLLKRSNCWSVDSRLLNIPEKRDLLEIKLRDHNHPETLINWIILENRQERFANKQNKNIILIIETSRTFVKAS